VELVIIQFICTDYNGHIITLADAVCFKGFILGKQTVTGNTTIRRMFGNSLTWLQVRKKNIAAAIGFCSENISITFSHIIYFHLEACTYTDWSNCLITVVPN